jgi:hypothetical protein
MFESSRRGFVKGITAGLMNLGLSSRIGANTRHLFGEPLSQNSSRPLKDTASNSTRTNAISSGFWIDSRRAELPPRPWRKVHLDFHNSQYVQRIGEKFNADEFGDRLLEANVNAIVVFAKDMHGYFYYPSNYGPVHPGLSFDLLGGEVAACRKRNIAVYAYYCTTWDHYLAEHHPEWLVFKRDRTTYLPKFDETPGWTALCLAHEDFVRLLLDHIREFVSRYPIDGAYLDMPVPIAGECFCVECLRQLRDKTLNPFDTRVQHEHKHALHKSFISRVSQLLDQARPGCQVDFNGQGVYGLGERIQYMNNLDIEALPTAFWGYYYFPTVVRYTRTFGVTTYGMTGRFQASWADFGGLKRPVQIETELASIIANGAHCDIGDQMGPGGRLDPAVYSVIGQCYGKIKALEPYLEGAVPVAEAALLTSGMVLESPGTIANYGLMKLMIESRLQFDVVEPGAEWERYPLIVLADDLRVDEGLSARLHAFIGRGKTVVVSNESGVLADQETSWLERYGMFFQGKSPYKPAYLLPQGRMNGDNPPYEYALYEGASQWRAQSPAQVLAILGEPAFQRNALHYTSHAQSPFDHATEWAAVACSGSAALFAFPLGLSYYNHGYWIYRSVFQSVLQKLRPVTLLQSNAPLSTELTLTFQPAHRNLHKKDRYLVHLVNFSPLRHTPTHPDFYEDPIPLTDVTVRINLPFDAVAARAIVVGQDLTIKYPPGGGIEVAIPRIPVHEVVCFEAAG